MEACWLPPGFSRRCAECSGTFDVSPGRRFGFHGGMPAGFRRYVYVPGSPCATRQNLTPWVDVDHLIAPDVANSTYCGSLSYPRECTAVLLQDFDLLGRGGGGGVRCCIPEARGSTTGKHTWSHYSNMSKAGELWFDFSRVSKCVFQCIEREYARGGSTGTKAFPNRFLYQTRSCLAAVSHHPAIPPAVSSCRGGLSFVVPARCRRSRSRPTWLA